MTDWWRSAALYQIYPRSFADTDRDGYGDIPGIRSKLPYLQQLGVDGVWISPWYPSPMADGGYDVADYRDIDPLFGTLADAEALIADAHAAGLKVIIDIVPNHCSSEHPWFKKALAAGPGSPERALFHFRDGRGEHGELPPNGWSAMFGGSAWQRVPDGQWYLHLYAPEQPDWNWDNPAVRAEFESILRFWFDRGIDGFRIDVADHLIKADGLPDLREGEPSPYTDQDRVHDIYKSWRQIANSYPDPRIFVGEMWSPQGERFGRYLRADELTTAFNFAYLGAPWRVDAFRHIIDTTLEAHESVGAAPTWVLSNHDVVRHVTRYGRAETALTTVSLRGIPVDLALGTRRARAAALMTMALPGCAYVYQGEELGLAEVEDIPDDLLQDPIWKRSGHTNRGRDGCRVPIPWTGHESPTWLPQPAAWAGMSAEVQMDDPDSMLNLYRTALHRRRAIEGAFAWRPSAPGVLDFTRGDRFACVVNFGPDPVPRPAGTVALASGPLDGDELPVDTAIWLDLDAQP